MNPNPILATLVLTSLLTAIGVYLVKNDCDRRYDKPTFYYGIFMVTICFIADGIMVAAVLL